MQKSLKEQDQSIAKQFHDIEGEIHQVQNMMPSPFTSCGSLASLDEREYDELYLTDQCEYEFRPRTSSLLLPSRNKLLSPNLHRKATANRAAHNNLIRPKSLTHLNTSEV